MAKRPNTPCAGGCGKLLWSGRDSLPSGQRKCNDCRRSETQARYLATDDPRATAPCTECGVEVSGGSTSAPPSRRKCQACRVVWREGKNRRRRALMRSAASEPYTTAEVAQRDGFACQLCGRKVDMDAKWPAAGSPSVDHVVPLSLGGPDTRANVQLAHLGCNVRKNNKVAGTGEQLRLVG